MKLNFMDALLIHIYISICTRPTQTQVWKHFLKQFRSQPLWSELQLLCLSAGYCRLPAWLLLNLMRGRKKKITKHFTRSHGSYPREVLWRVLGLVALIMKNVFAILFLGFTESSFWILSVVSDLQVLPRLGWRQTGEASPAETNCSSSV